MKKLYLRKLYKINNFDVWLVDGRYIRDNIDEEFTNFGQHYAYEYIPEDEFWIDKGSNLREEIYFIEHMLVENRLMAQGKTYDYARMKAKQIEELERLKLKIIREALKPMNHKQEIIDTIHKELYKKVGPISIWIVNGELVRTLFYLDFTEGGHDKVYHFVPKGEVWIEEAVSSSERKFVLLHEIHERNLMALKKLDYLSAHASSSKIEYYCRHHVDELDKKIENELKIAEKG